MFFIDFYVFLVKKHNLFETAALYDDLKKHFFSEILIG